MGPRVSAAIQPRLRTRAALALATATALAGCEHDLDPREASLVEVIVAADEPLLRARPELVEGKYRRMAAGLYDYYRGSFPVFLYDASRSESGLAATSYDAHVYPFSSGDAHPENFGTMRATDGSFAIEPNDFDGADRYPWLWELRRLAVGMVLAGRVSNPEREDLRASVRAAERSYALAAARGYALELARLHRGEAPERLEDDRGNTHFEDMFSRSRRDASSRRELAERTELLDGRRRLVRGAVDPDDPESVYADLPAFVLEALPDCLERYRASLHGAPTPAYFALKDAAREYGSGVASYARVRVVLLVEGPSAEPDDDVMLELKELADSGAVVVAPQGVHTDSVQERIQLARSLLWARSDAEPLWGTSELFGLPVQIKGEFDAYKTLRTSRMVDERGTPESLEALGVELGALLARMHAGSEARWPGTVRALAELSADVDAFAAEQAEVAIAYADLVEADHARFRRALERLGPRLGLRADPSDAPPPELAALYGSPP